MKKLQLFYAITSGKFLASGRRRFGIQLKPIQRVLQFHAVENHKITTKNQHFYTEVKLGLNFAFKAFNCNTKDTAYDQ
ncbi:hypothetical protein EGR_00526 [Echinococcus granulosus]|uniref:Uncharacterized protein n=1 Tax=Echinococcus granulosus TaxID=6210 RepID=W6UVC7_ECHGR|nr:hypothetical protein EGR_00526 [Echinococcus granulosus]EUB64576.1 hypothetical protein EGR_00526 [Echinococcus granulosus]